MTTLRRRSVRPGTPEVLGAPRPPTNGHMDVCMLHRALAPAQPALPPAPLAALPAARAAIPRRPERASPVPAPTPVATTATALDAYLPAHVRAHLERTYYARVSEQATLDRLVQDPAFLDDPARHVALFSDHGIAGRLRALAACGALAQEPSTVLREMLALAMGHSKSSVPHAVLHDPARLRRLMQETLRADLWARYRDRGREQDQEATTVARRAPRRTGRPAGPVDLEVLATQCPLALHRFYADVERESFGWLVCAHPEVRALVDDVVETIRALRCADVLRQRGTTLKTSGAYEVFVDQATAEAVYALRRGPDRVFLLRLPDPLSAGEANLAHSWVSQAGDLHIAFQRGAFATPAAVERAAHDAAVVVDDIQSDVVGSLARPRRRLRRDPGHRDRSRGAGRWRGRGGTRQRMARWRIVLEGVADNPAFAARVRAQLLRCNPRLQGRVRTTPPAPGAAPADGAGMEEARYAAAPVLDWDETRCQAALERTAATGQRVPGRDAQVAFAGAKVVTLQAGETLIAAETAAAFVYIPLEDGLSVLPLGGYPAATVSAWAPVGHTGVIRGAPRNATVVAQRPLRLLMLPRAVYLNGWHRPYSAAELRARLTQLHGRTPKCGATGDAF